MDPTTSDVIDFAAADRSGKPNSARIRILQAFGERLRQTGIRQITMTDLAVGLGMSKKTLYENFSNKEDVLRTTVELWVNGFLQRMKEAESCVGKPTELVYGIAMAHMDSLDRFSAAFWHELPRDFPEVHATVVRALAQANRQARMALQSFLRPDVAPRVATETYLAMISRAMDPEVCRRLDMSRRELTIATLEVWSKGALQQEEQADAREESPTGRGRDGVE